jgi:hypothetical protein
MMEQRFSGHDRQGESVLYNYQDGTIFDVLQVSKLL